MADKLVHLFNIRNVRRRVDRALMRALLLWVPLRQLLALHARLDLNLASLSLHLPLLGSEVAVLDFEGTLEKYIG